MSEGRSLLEERRRGGERKAKETEGWEKERGGDGERRCRCEATGRWGERGRSCSGDGVRRRAGYCGSALRPPDRDFFTAARRRRSLREITQDWGRGAGGRRAGWAGDGGGAREAAALEEEEDEEEGGDGDDVRRRLGEGLEKALEKGETGEEASELCDIVVLMFERTCFVPLV